MKKEPSFDYCGYPTEETLETIEKWSYGDGFFNLMEFVIKAWNKDYGKVRKKSFGDKTIYRFITGGWSGNESIISALEQNLMFWTICWLKSERGGCFEFELSEKDRV